MSRLARLNLSCLLGAVAMSLQPEVAERTCHFREFGYVRIPGLLDATTLAALYQHVVESSATGRLSEDKAVDQSSFAYGDPVMEEMLLELQPRVQAESGTLLYPTYSYFRVYRTGATLPRHTDRPSCEISLSLCLGYDAPRPWPIGMSRRGSTSMITLFPGDAVLYLGMECVHWRDPFEGESAAQVFLHYVDRFGPQAAFRFDQRPALTLERREV